MEKETGTEAEKARRLLTHANFIKETLARAMFLVDSCMEETEETKELRFHLFEAMLRVDHLRSAAASSVQEDGQGLNAMQSQPAPNAPTEHQSE
ncbi:MAG: hypothetical protein ACTTH5_02920 [Wolinella sp.]